MTINTWQKSMIVYALITLAVLYINFNNIIHALQQQYYVEPKLQPKQFGLAFVST